MLTIFGRFQQVMRRVGYHRAPLVFAHPCESLWILHAVYRTMEDCMGAVKKAGRVRFIPVSDYTVPAQAPWYALETIRCTWEVL